MSLVAVCFYCVNVFSLYCCFGCKVGYILDECLTDKHSFSHSLTMFVYYYLFYFFGKTMSVKAFDSYIILDNHSQLSPG